MSGCPYHGSDSVMPTTATTSPPIDRPAGTPRDVKVGSEPRVPEFDPRAGVAGSFTFPAAPKPQPPHRLVVIGDSLSHGFQSGAIYNTDISYPALIVTDSNGRVLQGGGSGPSASSVDLSLLVSQAVARACG